MGIELRWIVRRGFAIERDQPKLPRLCSRSPDCWLERTSTACSFAFLLFGFFISTPLVTVIKDTRLKSFVTIGITRGLVGAHTKQRGREQIERSQQTRTASNWSHGVKLVARPRVFDQQRCDFADPRTRRAPSSSAARQAFKNVELAGHDVHHPLSKNGWRWLHRTRPLFSTIFTSFISPPQDLDGVGWMAWAIQPENNE